MLNELLVALEMIKEGIKIIDNYNYTEIEEGLIIGDELEESTSRIKSELTYLEATLNEIE